MTIDNSWQSNYLEVAKWELRRTEDQTEGFLNMLTRIEGVAYRSSRVAGAPGLFWLFPTCHYCHRPREEKIETMLTESLQPIYDLEWKEGDELDKWSQGAIKYVRNVQSVKSKCVVLILNKQKKIRYDDINLYCSDIIELFRKFVNLFPVPCIPGMENPDK